MKCNRISHLSHPLEWKGPSTAVLQLITRCLEVTPVYTHSHACIDEGENTYIHVAWFLVSIVLFEVRVKKKNQQQQPQKAHNRRQKRTRPSDKSAFTSTLMQGLLISLNMCDFAL